MTPDSTTSPSAGTGDALREAIADLAKQKPAFGGMWADGYAGAIHDALRIIAALPQDRGGEDPFLDAIHARTPTGAWIAVQHHPDGDWSVAEHPLPWLPGGEVAASPSRVGVPDDVDVRAVKAGPTADELEALGKAPWQGEQPIEEHARYWKGRPWVPLEAAIKDLQFWQRRDYEHGRAAAIATVRTDNVDVRAKALEESPPGEDWLLEWLYDNFEPAKRARAALAHTDPMQGEKA